MSDRIEISDEEVDEFVGRMTEEQETLFAEKLLNEFRRRTGRTEIEPEDRELSLDIVQELIHNAFAKEAIDGLMLEGLVHASVLPNGKLGYSAVPEVEKGLVNPSDIS